MSGPLSNISKFRFAFSVSSRAENMPAGPAPTIITSNCNGVSSKDPNLHVITVIYVLMNS
jgi:hypothetical protein